jgi:hypothetical protein
MSAPTPRTANIPTPERRISNLNLIAADPTVNNFARSICAEAAEYLSKSARPEAEPKGQLIPYIDALFVSGNDVPVQRAWINDESWALIKECLAAGIPLDHQVIESEVVWRRSKERIAATGDAIRRDSPLAAYREAMNESPK